MKIGYVSLNYSIDCKANKKFRLSNFSKSKFLSTAKNNINCLKKILKYNVNNSIKFFRINSNIIPFASHSINNIDWKNIFKNEFIEIGKIVKNNNIRISMHPGQYTVLNSKNNTTISNSIKELNYHVDILNLLDLKPDAKIQIHIGGVYNNKSRAMKRFINNYKSLPPKIKKYLVIENDNSLYSLKDCIYIHKKTGVPIIFDTFHHECFNNKENIKEAFSLTRKTWNEKDGAPMIDYSSQEDNKRRGTHTKTIDINHFENILKELLSVVPSGKFDIMLEIKNKEKSAKKIYNFLNQNYPSKLF